MYSNKQIKHFVLQTRAFDFTDQGAFGNFWYSEIEIGFNGLSRDKKNVLVLKM